MAYKLREWDVQDIRSGRVTRLRARSRRSLERRLGPRRSDEVIIRRVDKG